MPIPYLPAPDEYLARLGALARELGLGALFTQHARLITLDTPQASGLPDTLIVERFDGREGVNELFCFDIEALSLSTHLSLKDFIGEELTLRVLQADGRYRAWHGYCTQMSWLGADGGMARYRLRLEPFLAFLRLRRDSYIFQDKNAQEIATALLDDYPAAHFKFDITQTLAPRPICTQYRESDLDFFTRLLASEGLSWRFEHEQEGTLSPVPQAESSPRAKHQLVIFDIHAPAPTMPGGAAIRFHGVRATDARDAINRFSAQRQVQSNAVALSSWDPSQVSAPAAELISALDAGDLPVLSIYDGSGERRYADNAAAAQHADLALRALELGNKTFTGAGSVRTLAEGHTFTLTQHTHYLPGENAFTVLWVEHAAANNLNTGLASPAAPPGLAHQTDRLSSHTLEHGTYRNRFACVRQAVAIVPAATVAPRRPTALGPQTAFVVGVEGAPLTTGRDHHVKIQFPWQRGVAPHPGGLSDTGTPGDNQGDDQGNAPGNDRSGTWVRVAEALAGPNWGSHFTPRIGTEVLVDFMEGDMDRPVVVACLYNGEDLPPYSAGMDSNANHPGTLSGIHSHSLDGAGYNQWVIDDTQHQLRMRLASSTAASQLNLGHLIHQSPTSAQRGAYRGQGFELRTDAWAAIRGADGLLIATTQRPGLGASVTSTQMDAAEAVAQMKAAHALSNTLSDAATHQTALSSQTANQGQNDLIKALDPAQQGKYTSAVNGQPAQKTQPGTKDLDPTQPVEKFATPLILLDSPANINWASPASTALYAGQHLHWTSQADLHLTAAHTLAGVSGQATTLFTHGGGIQAIAAHGPVSLQAHTDQLDILADDSVTVTSVNGDIEVKANQKIVLQADGASITLEGPNITLACSGSASVKGAVHGFEGAERGEFEVEGLPVGSVAVPEEVIANVLHIGKYHLFKTDNRPFDGYHYEIRGSDGKILASGLTGVEGKTKLVTTQEAELIKGYKSTMRESERITENWQGKLASVAMRAQTP